MTNNDWPGRREATFWHWKKSQPARPLPGNKIVYIDWGRFIRRPRLNDLCCSVATRLRMSRFGSLADIQPKKSDVCFAPKSGHGSARSWCTFCAKSGLRNWLKAGRWAAASAASTSHLWAHVRRFPFSLRDNKSTCSSASSPWIGVSWREAK